MFWDCRFLRHRWRWERGCPRRDPFLSCPAEITTTREEHLLSDYHWKNIVGLAAWQFWGTVRRRTVWTRGCSRNQSYVTLTGNDGEFFLYEFRQRRLGCQPSQFGIVDLSYWYVRKHGGRQIACWQVALLDGINSYASHQCCDLVEAGVSWIRHQFW